MKRKVQPRSIFYGSSFFYEGSRMPKFGDSGVGKNQTHRELNCPGICRYTESCLSFSGLSGFPFLREFCLLGEDRTI